MCKKFNTLDKIDISLYLVYADVRKIMAEIEKDHKGIFESITVNEFRKYINIRYCL